jgi:hypothetical protein
MAAAQKRRIVKRAMMVIAIPVGALVWYFICVLCLRGAGAAGWLPAWAYMSPIVSGFDDPVVAYIKAELPGAARCAGSYSRARLQGRGFTRHSNKRYSSA